MESKVFIVTGASRGIGLAVAKHLLKTPGNKVVAISRSLKELLLLKEEFPTQVEILAQDMTQPEVRHQPTPWRPKPPSHLTTNRLRKRQLNLRSRSLADWTEWSSTMAPCPP